MNNTRNSIIEKAIDLFRTQGYENTSVVDICNAANITKGTFYYHFANKDELCSEFYESLFEDFTSVMSELILISNTKDQLWRVYEYSIDRTIALGPELLKSFYLADIQKGFQLFTPFGKIDKDNFGSRQIKLQIELVRKGQKLGEIRAGDPEVMVQTYVAAISGIAIAWGCSKGAFDEKEEIRKAFETIFGV